jgi:hypothetical protein
VVGQINTVLGIAQALPERATDHPAPGSVGGQTVASARSAAETPPRAPVQRIWDAINRVAGDVAVGYNSMVARAALRRYDRAT